MQRRRKPAGRKPVDDSIPPDEIKFSLDAKVLREPQRIAEVAKIRAAAKDHVLAVIDPLSGRLIDK